MNTTFYFKAWEDTYVTGSNPSHTPCRSPRLLVGADGRGELISYIFFNLSTLPGSLLVTRAELTLYFAFPFVHGKTPDAIFIQALENSFSDCQTNFQNRPGTLPKGGVTVPVQPHQWFTSITVDLTEMVKLWYSGKMDNYGLAVLPKGFSHSGYLSINSSNTLNSTLHPTLAVHTRKPDIECAADSYEEVCIVTGEAGYTRLGEVWCYNDYSFIAKNESEKKFLIKLQCSPDGINFIDEEPLFELEPGRSGIYVNRFFTRYARLKYCLAPGEAGTGKMKAWLQGRR